MVLSSKANQTPAPIPGFHSQTPLKCFSVIALQAPLPHSASKGLQGGSGHLLSRDLEAWTHLPGALKLGLCSKQGIDLPLPPHLLPLLFLLLLLPPCPTPTDLSPQEFRIYAPQNFSPPKTSPHPNECCIKTFLYKGEETAPGEPLEASTN